MQRRFRRVGVAVFGGGGQVFALQGADPIRGPRRLLFLDRPPHFVQPGLEQFLAIERGPAREQFIQQDTERVDVAAGIDIQAAEAGLFRAHVGRGADKLLELGEQRLLC